MPQSITCLNSDEDTLNTSSMWCDGLDGLKFFHVV